LFNLSSLIINWVQFLEPKELLCKQKEHAKVIEKGKPEDATIGIKNAQVSS